ncbi:MAG: FAD binding domain-containing protein [Gammaproteobacteria bacterium]
MYPAPIDDYLRPRTVAEAVKAIGKYKAGEAFCIAGGQSLMQAIKSRLVAPKCLIDLQDIEELRGIAVNAKGVAIGAMTRYADIAADERLNGAYQALIDAASHVGDRQVRNRGTIGGSVCWNYIAACMPTVALGLGVTLKLVSGAGKARDIGADDFFKGPLETARRDKEILQTINLPKAPKRAGSMYQKWGLVSDALPVIGVCACVQLDAKGACSAARIAVGGLASGPKRAKAAEQALLGKKAGDADAIAMAMSAAADEIDTQSDHWADGAYRKQLIRTLGAEVVASAFARAVV